jgi:hypothetical protein
MPTGCCFNRLAAIPFNEVGSGRGHESFLQGILGTRNLIHYLFRRSFNGIAVKRTKVAIPLNQQAANCSRLDSWQNYIIGFSPSDWAIEPFCELGETIHKAPMTQEELPLFNSHKAIASILPTSRVMAE